MPVLPLAVPLLPALSLLLVVMSRVEDRLLEEDRPAQRARHARPRRLRLIPGGISTGSNVRLSAQRSRLRKNAA